MDTWLEEGLIYRFCLQEAKSVGKKSREIAGYRLCSQERKHIIGYDYSWHKRCLGIIKTKDVNMTSLPEQDWTILTQPKIFGSN